MRTMWVVLLAVACVGGAAWLLLRDDAAPSPLGGEPGTAREGGGARPAGLEVERHEVPRVGVGSTHDRVLNPDPDAPPWRERLLRFAVPTGTAATGEHVVAALAQHLYVRAPDAETLQAFRGVTLEGELPPEMPLLGLEPLLRRAGYAFEVRDPIFMLHRVKDEPR